MKFFNVIAATLLLTFLVSPVKADETLKAANLRCEYLNNPLAIEVKQPRLSWLLNSIHGEQKQTSYRILVACSEKTLNQNIGDLWDSGQVKSSRSVHVVYAGKQLQPRQKTFWKVRVWDKDGHPSAWSETATWEMALDPSDWRAKWTGISQTDNPETSEKNPAFYFRKRFQLADSIKKARANISGLGYYEFYINGKKVGDHVLSPNHTNYDRRQSTDFDEKRIGNMSTRVLYETFDATSFLHSGENVVAVCLGNGWYFQNEREEDIPYSYDTPRFIAQLEIDLTHGGKEVIVSDGTWKTSLGPIVHNGIYSGEIYDARQQQTGWNDTGFDDSDWQQANIVRAPKGKLMAQISPADRVLQTIKPISLTKANNGTWRFDMGRLISGWIRLQVSGARGDSIVMKFVEDYGPTYGQTDTYILKGGGQEVWEPRFTWHAFRYVDVIDPPFPLTLDNLEGRVVNTDVHSAGEFHSSNRLFEQILQNYQWTQLGNIHSGVPSDCPHRERRGYTGDGQISAQAAIYNFDLAVFYTKWLNDIADAQNTATGYVPNTAPYQGGGGGTAWGSAYVIIPWYMYLYYGDERILERHYDGMKKWINYLTQQLDDDGILIERNLGEWVPPAPTEIPPSLVSTAYFYHDLMLMANIAAVLGREKDVSDFEKLAHRTQRAFHKKYYHAAKKSYSIGRQGANVFALGFGLVPEQLQNDVFQSLVHNIENNTHGHFDTGMMATPLLLEVLTRYGRVDLAYTIMNQRDFPSFGFEIENGATTIWETWPGDASRSHPMFGSVCAWFYQALAGINPDPEQPGFKHIIIKPQPLSGLTFVNGVYESIYGAIQSHWRLQGDDLVLRVSIPVNTTASVYLPAAARNAVTVHGESASFVGFKNHIARYDVEAGDYTFTSHRVTGLLAQPMPSTPIISPTDTLAFLPDTVVVRISNDHPGAEIRYTINGDDPDATSPLYNSPFNVVQNSIVKAKAFHKDKVSAVGTSTITFIDPHKNGLRYDYYEGAWKRLPDFRKMSPISSGKIFDIGLQHIIAKADKFAVVISGSIEITHDGDYTFSLVSNDGSSLLIDDIHVVDNDGEHSALEKSGQTALSAGRHSFAIHYFQAGGGMLLQAFMSGPDMPKQRIPASMLFTQ